MSEKVILSHDGALKKKYGVAGFKAIRQAVDKLIKVDGKRGLTVDRATSFWIGLIAAVLSFR